jgi:hypothetical protein
MGDSGVAKHSGCLGCYSSLTGKELTDVSKELEGKFTVRDFRLPPRCEIFILLYYAVHLLLMNVYITNNKKELT